MYLEKPEWISWDDVLSCLHEAHKVNKRKGFTMPGYNMSMEEFKEKLGDGKCFVALDGNKVIGVNSVKFIKSRRWCTWGKRVAYCGLDGILKAYQGTDVYSSLNAIRNKCIDENRVEAIEFNTAEHNKAIIKQSIKRGAKMVQYARITKEGYHPVVLVRWLHECPYPDWFCNFMFKLSKGLVKIIWRSDRHLQGVKA